MQQEKERKLTKEDLNWLYFNGFATYKSNYPCIVFKLIVGDVIKLHAPGKAAASVTIDS